MEDLITNPKTISIHPNNTHVEHQKPRPMNRTSKEYSHMYHKGTLFLYLFLQQLKGYVTTSEQYHNERKYDASSPDMTH